MIFTPVQCAAIKLMNSDLRYLYTVMKRINPDVSNYIPSVLPYMGVIVDGIEDWMQAFNNSSKTKLEVPFFDENEKEYYEKIRDSIKIWEKEYSEIYTSIERAYKISDDYFSSKCRPISKKLKLYDTFGIDTINGAVCGNTILCYHYNPLFSYDGNNGEYIKNMAIIAGKYIVLYSATSEYQINPSFKFDFCDYGGVVKSPVGSKFSDKFVLFSMLGQINFILYCLDGWIEEEIPTKLRFAYLLYFSLLHIIPQINSKLNIELQLDEQWKSREFRNAMAHYKLGVSLREDELILDDLLCGLTQKYFGRDYMYIKGVIINELKKLAIQIGKYLKLKDRMIYGENVIRN